MIKGEYTSGCMLYRRIISDKTIAWWPACTSILVMFKLTKNPVANGIAASDITEIHVEIDAIIDWLSTESIECAH